MQQLELYCMEMRCINDLDTYIISPQYYKKLLSDTDLMKLLWWNKDQHGQHHLPPDWQEERIKSMMEVRRLLAGGPPDYAYGGERCPLLLRNRKQVAGHPAHLSEGAMPELRHDAE